MRTVPQIIDEINAASVTMKKRPGTDASGGAIADKLAKQIGRAISNLEAFTVKDAEMLYSAIEASALRSTDHLTAAIDGRLEQELDKREDEDNSARSQKTQHLLNPESWLTETLYSLAISESKSFDAKLQGCADHLACCGVINPSEKTIGAWLSAMVCLHFSSLPQYNKLYSYILDLKSMVVNCRRTSKFATVWNYPKTPELLPDAAYKAIFSDDSPPIPVTIPKFSEVYTSHMPLRSTSSLLKKAAKGEVVNFALSPPCLSKCKAENTPRRSCSRVSLAAKSEPSSGVKSEPEDSIKSEPAEYDTKQMPAWAADLIGCLRGTDVPGPVPPSCQPTIKKAMAELPEGLKWACEPHDLLEYHCDRAASPVTPKEEEPSSGAQRMKAQLRPKGNLTLRLHHRSATTESAAQAKVTGDCEDRVSIEAYEEAASAALKSTAARRADEAKQRKKERDEEKKLIEAAKSNATSATPCKKAEPEVKQDQKRTRITGKQPVAKVEHAAVDPEPAHKPAMADPRPVRKIRTMKRPAAVFSPDAPPPCPADDDSTPIEYNGGRIYNTSNTLRVLRCKTDMYTEKSFSKKKWTLEGGFKAGLEAIDTYWRDMASKLQGEDVD